jgi:hypothetical protein
MSIPVRTISIQKCSPGLRKHTAAFIVLSFFDSNENLHIALRTDEGSFDVLPPSLYMTHILYEDAGLAELYHALLPTSATSRRSQSTSATIQTFPKG